MAHPGQLRAQVSIFEDGGTRSGAVDVIYFRAKPLCEGGFGGKQVVSGVYWGHFSELFFSVIFNLV